MKNLFVLSIVFVLLSCGTKTPYETFKKKNKDEVAISFGVSAFVINTLIRDKEFREFTKQVSGIKKYQVLVSKSNPAFLKSNFDVFLKKNNFEEIVYTTKGNEKICIFSFEKGEQLKEVIVELENDSQVLLVKVQGNLKINDFQKLVAFNEGN
ncbi:DUF4252 domain-containing protein [Flavobacterium sp. IMCC34518]|uniref:DUF4252 domain-containing protein n=1 Tax=Flavobacterium sp. IMCC34518 TaxID=3003623 RepID=UPI002482C7F2|nr:DUF4252 domain-containing protein [Flavobacterium sp. IMCC34518]